MKKANLPTTENAVIIICHFLADMISRILRFLFDKNPAIHRARRKRKLSKVQKEILVEQSDFYKQLNQRYQRFFEHRLSTFIQTYEFVGRNGYKVNEETKVLIGTSYITLTFGKRKFITDIFDKIVIYPDVFLSKSTGKMHKGEFNPKLKTVVFSWKHFLEGNKVKNDNLNLGIHEFTHIIHMKSLQRRDMSSMVFRKEYLKLIDYLQHHKEVRSEILDSGYFRKYAFKNQYEFLAVLIENFIETPQEFKKRFPMIYKKIKRMLNFNFLHY